MRQKRITIEDVAKASNVSISTISRFLNGRYESMSATTKERIAQIIAELNYKPNVLAQGLKGNITKTIAIVVVNISYPFCVSVIRSLSTILTEAGYRLIVSDSGGDKAREQGLLESLMAQQVEGIIIQTNGANNDLLAQMAKELPVIIIDRQFDIPHTINVVTNNKEVSFQLTEQLFSAGYQDVVYLTELIAGISTRKARLEGYEEACSYTNHKSFVVRVNKDDPDSFDTAMIQIRDLPIHKPAAVYTANGLIMLPLYPLIRDEGWKIPEEYGLATFDEPDWVYLTTPPLTCVRQPTAEIGELSGHAVLRALQLNKPPQKRQISIVPSHITLRESTRLS
ncbi:MAG: LacI family DNA-binding transcriptional regulator [Bacilli bacterium]